MERRGIAIIAGAVVILGIVIAYFSFRGVQKQQPGASSYPEHSNAFNETKSTTYSSNIPPNAELTKPNMEVPAAPHVAARLRVFDVSASKSGYNPSEIVVNKGDSITLNFTSTDGDYDISFPDMGLYQFSKMGTMKIVAFQALTQGTFTYLCRDHCPGGSVIKGALIVK